MQEKEPVVIEKEMQITLDDKTTVNYNLVPDSNCDGLPLILKSEKGLYEDRGIQDVELEKIIGSGRFKDYDVNFMPKSPDLRWKIVYKSMRDNGEIPGKGSPISTYLIDGFYYIGSDGNRRVSVAKTLGWKKIKCEVIAVSPTE